MNRFAWFSSLCVAGILIALAGCGGGGSSGTAPYVQPKPNLVPVTFSVTVGATAPQGVRRHAAYLSPNTQSLAVMPVVFGYPNTAPTVIDTTPSSPNCAPAGGNITCTAIVKAPPGLTAFSISTYSQTGAKGQQLSLGTITVDVKASSSVDINTFALTFSPNDVGFHLTLSPNALQIGTSASLLLSANAVDSTGAIIVGSTPYLNPIFVGLPSVADISNPSFFGVAAAVQSGPICTLFATAVCYAITSAQGLTLTYDGTPPLTNPLSISGALSASGAVQSIPVEFSTPAPGTCAGSVIRVCPGSIIFANPAASPVPLSVTESGVTVFTANASSCAFNGNSFIALINNGLTATGSVFTVSAAQEPLHPPAAGGCTIKFTDAAKNTTGVTVTLQSAVTPTPSPTPTPYIPPTPTPPPPGVVKLSPAELEFSSSSAASQTIVASESGYTSFSVNAAGCAGIVTITPSTGTTFTVTPVSSLAGGGSCTPVFSDIRGGTGSPLIFVDGSTITIQSRKSR
jgi:hypothetical protein